MVRSRLPFLSFLGALLVLSPELGMAGKISKVALNNPAVQKALAFAVEQYNQDREDSPNYFKVLTFLKAQKQVENRMILNFRLRVELIKTECVKDAGRLTYGQIKKCSALLGNHERPTCYFEVIPYTENGSPERKMVLAITTCL